MNTINSYLDAICSALESEFQGLSVELLAGMEIDPETIRISPPTAFVAVAQGPIRQGMSGLAEMDAPVVILLVEEHALHGSRQSRAADLADRVFHFVNRNRWELQGTGPARVSLVKNMYRPDLERQGLGQYGLSFNQRVILESEQVEPFTVPTEVSADFNDQGPEVIYES